MDYKKAVTRVISGFLAVVMAGSQFATVAYATEAYGEQAAAAHAEATAEPEAAPVTEAAEVVTEETPATETESLVADTNAPAATPAAEAPAQTAETELAAAAESTEAATIAPENATDANASVEEVPEFLNGEELPLVQQEDGSYAYTEEPTLIQNEVAAAAAQGSDNTEYLGDVEGTNLSLYKVTPDADAIAMDSSPDPDEAAMYRAWFAADAPTGDELKALVEQADAWADHVEEMADVLALSEVEAQPVEALNEEVELPTSDAAQPGTAESAMADTIESETVETVEDAQKNSEEVGGETVDAAPENAATPENKGEISEEVVAAAEAMFAPNESDTISFETTDAAASAGAARGASAQAEIYVIREDTIYVHVMDVDGNELNGASVYLAWTDENGQKHEYQTTTKTTNGHIGYAEIPGMKGIHSGFISVAKDGYRIYTQLNADLKGGSLLTYALTPTHKYEIYPRAVDLDGIDIIGSTCDLTLVSSSTDAYDLTVLMAGTDVGRNDFPAPTIHADNEADEVYLNQIEPTDSYYYNYPGDTPGTNTVTYTFRKKWSEKLEGNDTVLRDGDKLTLCYGDKVQALNVNVEEAVCTAQWLDGFGLNLIGGEGASFKISESVPLIGGDSLSAECLDLKVTLIISPGGKVIAGYGSNIGEYINKEDFLGKAYEPSTDKKFEGITSSIKNAYAKRKDMLKQGKAFLAGSSKGTHFVDTAAEVDVRVEALGMGRYDRSTGYLTFDLSAIVSVMGQFSITSYYLIPAPVYFGLEVNPSVSLDGTIGMRFKPTNITGTFGFSSSTRLEVDIALAMTAFAGVGLRGVVGAEVTGTIGVDIPIVLYGADNPPPGHSYPHARGDASFTIGLTAYFLMFRYRHTFFDTGVKIFDTWDDSKARLSTSNVEMQTERYNLDFTGAAENETAAELSEATTDAAPDTDIITETTVDADNYANGNTPALAKSRFALIDGETKAATDVFKSDNLVAVTSGDDKGYLFRQAIIKGSNGKSTPHVVFQEILDAGGLAAQSYTVPMPGDYDTVYSFSAMVNHNEKYESSRNFVYIAMRIGHSGLTDLDARAVDSRVCTLVLDLNDRHVVKPPYVYERATEGYFSYIGTPQVYGGSGNPVAACLTSTNYKDEKPYANGYEAFSNAAWRGSKAKDLRTGYAKLPIDNLTIAGSSNPSLSGSTIKILYTYENQLIGDDFYFNFGGFLETKFHDYYPARISNLAYPNVGDVAAGNEDLSSPYLVSGGTLYKLNQYLHGQKMDCVTESGLDFGFAGGDSSVSYFHAKGSNNLQLVSVRQGVDTEEDASGNVVRSTPYSTVTVYNALKNSEGKYVMYGPQEYRIDGRNMLHAAGFLKDEYMLKLFYTADEQTYVTDKPTGVYGTAEYKDGTLRETCDLYTFDVGRDYNAGVVALASDKPFIQQTDGTVALTLAVKNQCSRPISRFTLLVEDDAGRKVYENEHMLELYPGQTRQLTINPKILSAWSGATSLTAKITRAGDDMQFFVKSPQGDRYAFEIPSISVFASVVSHKSGTVFAANNAGTTVFSAATFGADASTRAAAAPSSTTPVVESNDSMTVNLQLSNASIVPAENMRAEIYRWNGYGEIMDGTEENPEPVHTYQIGTLAETSMGGMDTSVNMFLPLDDAWFDYACGEIEIRVVGDGIEPQSTWVTNPNGGPMDFVITAPDDDFYGTTTGDGMYFLGQEVTVTATPKRGYVFDHWINSEQFDDDDPVIVSTDATYTFNLECNVSFIAIFKEDGTAHQVVLYSSFDEDLNNMGIVAMDGYPLNSGILDTAYRVDHGATVHVRAKPYAGYQFERWVDADTEQTVSTSADFDYTVDHAVYLCAVFRELPETHYEPVRTEFNNTPQQPEQKAEDKPAETASEATPTATPTPAPTGKIPMTADSFNATLWIALMGFGLAGMLYFRKKYRK